MNDDAVLDRATQALRRHTDHGWTLVRENALLKALSAFRPSAPVRGRTATADGVVDYVVAADVVVAALRESVVATPQAAPLTITCSTDAHDQLTAVTIEIVAAFDEPLVPLAAAVRRAAAARLRSVLGDLAPPATAVSIDLAITDVMSGDLWPTARPDGAP
ncbi:hypothetical protein ACFP63_19695 [Oerskovia jenensis]|uniref:Asp23/Gls24 family envelope stress response protein n=1 Tax=Oerskovia jenensis TaxID=162169 RepID=A0ABS2LKQ8_9CELL|nr:hypothetical protein [Oerskovia jenensis]MBM7481002.1 hypothetical protein [Oerskovia jenensis]